MSRLASGTLVAAAALVLFAAGCDDEDLPAPDAGGTAPRDGGGDGAAPSGDGSAADAAAADAPAGDGGGGGAEAGAPSLPYNTPLTVEEERGRYLVENVIACVDCHTPFDAMGVPIRSRYMAGVECFIKLPNGDCLHTRNLTSDPTGLGNRTKEDIKRMFQDGIRPAATGDVALHPVMPYYVFKNMDAADADAIAAFLMKIKPVPHMLPARGASFNVPAPAAALNPDSFPTPASNYPNRESALRGRYLTTKTGLCLECHTQHNMAGPEPLMTAKYFQGGEMYMLGPGLSATAKNLTSDPTTGLGNWSVQDIVRVLKEGKDKEGKGICPPMPAGPMAAYGGLTNQDATDIAHYLKSLPPAVNAIVDQCSWPPMGGMMMGDGGAPAGDGAAPAGDAATSPGDGSAG